MTDEQAQELLNKLIEEFGDLLPNPEHYPQTFDYYLKIYEHNNPRTNHH
jgi:hypothetical protein